MNKIKIDPEKFAYAVLNNFQADAIDKERIAKEHIGLYLQSYLLAEEFNHLEDDKFKLSNDPEYRKMMLAMNKNINDFY
ncbi:hypothetical protein OGZ51_07070 [Lactococcus lactis]|uniref:Phage protein n=1 Tax=Lactococcus lactis TaxID=1358 RepID=A0A9X4S627_9LACT|nr:hypothetical protein [Lactococcus lactis]MDG4983901.1 hypothetical protein [Lactococcus lactis]